MGKNLYDFYCNYFANIVSGGKLFSRKNLSSLSIKPQFDRILTKSSVKKIIVIKQFPLDFNTSFSTVLNRRVSKAFPNCKINISIQTFKSDLNVKSSEFKRSMALAENKYAQEKELFSNLSSTEKGVGKKLYLRGGGSRYVTKQILDSLKDNFDSYDYCNKVIMEGNTLFSCFMFVEIVAPDDPTLMAVRELVFNVLDQFLCYTNELHKTSSTYMETISPTGFSVKGKLPKEFTGILLSNENLAQLMPYKSHGFIGDGTGTLMGVDIESNTPFILNFFRTGDRQVNVFLSPSGKGKTINAFLVAMDLMNSGIHCSALDVKGQEWNKLFAFVKGIEFDISDGSGIYVNTLRLDDIEVDVKSAGIFFDSAISSTVNLLKILSGYTYSSTSDDSFKQECLDAEMIMRTAVIKYYSKNLIIKENPRTFKNSSKLNYLGLLDVMKELSETGSYASYSEVINKIINRCLSIIEGTNIFSGRELSVNDVIDAPLVVYSLNKNKDQSDSGLFDSIRTFMVSFLDMKKIYARKSLGLGTSCFYEELQRKNEFRALINFISAVVTGARSSNVTVFLLCNTPSVLVSDDVQTITSNISSYMVGPLNKNDIEVLTYLGLEDIIPKVNKMRDNQDLFNHCFVCCFDTGEVRDTVIYKSVVPPSILERLKTRDAITT